MGQHDPARLPTDADLRRVRDGEVLWTTPSGLQLICREKHEWRATLASLKPDDFKRQTDPVRGSKFLAAWTRLAYVTWVEQQLDTLEWDAKTRATEHTIELPDAVGYSRGEAVYRIRIEISSRCVHAYPVKE